MLELNDIKEALFEQEQDRRQREEELTALKQETERTKNEIAKAKLELARAKEERQRQETSAKIELLRAKEERQNQEFFAKQREKETQKKSADFGFLAGLVATFLGLMASIILFILIILKG